MNRAKEALELARKLRAANTPKRGIRARSKLEPIQPDTSSNKTDPSFDAELMCDIITVAGFHIEKGVRKYPDYSAVMIEELGEVIRPYLRSAYEAVRNYPGIDATGMSTDEEIIPESTPAKTYFRAYQPASSLRSPVNEALIVLSATPPTRQTMRNLFQLKLETLLEEVSDSEARIAIETLSPGYEMVMYAENKLAYSAQLMMTDEINILITSIDWDQPPRPSKNAELLLSSQNFGQMVDLINSAWD